MSPSSFLISISTILLLIAYALYMIGILVDGIDVERVLLPSTIIQSAACAIAILLEREFRRSVLRCIGHLSHAYPIHTYTKTYTYTYICMMITLGD